MLNEYIVTEFFVSDDEIKETGRKLFFGAKDKKGAVKKAEYYLGLSAKVNVGPTGLVLYHGGKGYTVTLHRPGERAMREYIIWGIPPNETEETILYTKPKSMDEAKFYLRRCQELGATKCRIQVIDFSQSNINEMFKNSLNI